METQQDLAKLVERQAAFMYSEDRCNDERYLATLEYMIMCTVLRNAEITHNQLRGLLRNQYKVPETLTSRVVAKLCSLKVAGDEYCALLVDIVKHDNAGATRTVEHLRCHPLLRSQAALAQVYAQNQDHLALLDGFAPERYRRKPRMDSTQ